MTQGGWLDRFCLNNEVCQPSGGNAKRLWAQHTCRVVKKALNHTSPSSCIAKASVLMMLLGLPKLWWTALCSYLLHIYPASQKPLLLKPRHLQSCVDDLRVAALRTAALLKPQTSPQSESGTTQHPVLKNVMKLLHHSNNSTAARAAQYELSLWEFCSLQIHSFTITWKSICFKTSFFSLLKQYLSSELCDHGWKFNSNRMEKIVMMVFYFK